MTKDEAWKKVAELQDIYLAREKAYRDKMKKSGVTRYGLDGPKSELQLEFERKAKAIIAQIDE